MTLLPNEVELLRSNQDKVILTNQRIQLEDREWGRSSRISIFLEDISSIQVHYKSTILWLLLAGLSFLVLAYLAFVQYTYSNRYGYSGDDGPLGAAIAGVVIFILLWRFSRRHIISIHPDGGAPLHFLVSGMNNEQIESFTDQVQAAKALRMSHLFGKRDS